MEGSGYRQHHRPFNAVRLGDLDGTLDSGFVAGQDNLPAAIVVGGRALACRRGFRGDRLGRVELNPDERSHGASAHGDGLLHGPAADAQEAGRIGNGQGLSGRKRRIFPKRVTGNEGRIATEIDTGLRFKRAKRGERDCHQRRLRILGEGERLGRPIPHRVAELLPKRRVDFLKDPARRRKGFGQSLPMPTA